MSVQKNTSNFLKHSGLSFTTIINETMAMIPDDGALGIYCYLASKPENWNICNVHLQNRFNKGRDYIQKKMSILKSIGAIKTEAIKDEKGKVLYWETSLCNVIQNHNTENPYSGQSYPQSTILKTHILEKPESGKTGTSNKRSLQIKEKAKNRESTERKKRVPLSEDFKPDQEREAKAKAVSQRCNIPEDVLLSKFIAISKSTAKKSTDWQIEYELFLLREKPTIQKSTKESKSHQEIKSTVPDFEPIDHIKSASVETVNENMIKIRQMLSGKIINGQSERESYARKENRAR
jgi:hypothetical protein